MLNDSPVFPSIRVTEISKAKEFYEGKLGLKVIYDQPGELLLEAGKKSRISTATHTLAVFYVSDIYKTLEDLASKGVKPVTYNIPGIKTDKKGVIGKGNKKGAWVKDPDGNILGLSQIK